MFECFALEIACSVQIRRRTELLSLSNTFPQHTMEPDSRPLQKKKLWSQETLLKALKKNKQ